MPCKSRTVKLEPQGAGVLPLRNAERERAAPSPRAAAECRTVCKDQAPQTGVLAASLAAASRSKLGKPLRCAAARHWVLSLCKGLWRGVMCDSAQRHAVVQLPRLQRSRLLSFQVLGATTPNLVLVPVGSESSWECFCKPQCCANAAPVPATGQTEAPNACLVIRW